MVEGPTGHHEVSERHWGTCRTSPRSRGASAWHVGKWIVEELGQVASTRRRLRFARQQLDLFALRGQGRRLA